MAGNTTTMIAARSRRAVELIREFLGQLLRVRHHLDRLHQNNQDPDHISADNQAHLSFLQRRTALDFNARYRGELEMIMRILSAAVKGHNLRSRSASLGQIAFALDIVSPAKLLTGIALHLLSKSRLDHCVLHEAVFQIIVMDNARSPMLSRFITASEGGAIDHSTARTSVGDSCGAADGVDTDPLGSFAAPRSYKQFLLAKAAVRLATYLTQDKTPIDLLNSKISSATRELYIRMMPKPKTLSVIYQRLRRPRNLPYSYASALRRDGSCKIHKNWPCWKEIQRPPHWMRLDREREEWDEFVEEQGEQVTGGLSAYKTILRLIEWFNGILRFYEQYEDQGDALMGKLCDQIFKAISMYKAAGKTYIIKSFRSPIMISVGSFSNGRKNWMYVLRGGAVHPQLVTLFANKVRHWVDFKSESCFLHQAVFEIAMRDNMKLHVLYRKKLKEGEQE